MIRRLRVTCCLLLLSVCFATSVAAAPPELAGTWRASIHIPEWQLHAVRTELRIDRDSDQGFHGRSRRGAVRDALGFWRALIGAVMSRDLRGGSWLWFETEPYLDANNFKASLRSAFTGNLQLECSAGVASFSCSMARQGKPFGTLAAARSDAPVLPIRDYAGLFKQIDEQLASRHYRPDALNRPEWRRPRQKLEQLLERAQDDLDALAAWQQVTGTLPDSHVRLLRSDGAAATTSVASDSSQGIKLERKGAIAVLTIASFGFASELAAERLQSVFRELEQQPAAALIIDLRGNTGGNLSSMLVAAHLMAEPVAAGYFLTRKWWIEHDRAPGPEAAGQFPEFSGHDVGALRHALAENAGLKGMVLPRSPRYAGPVYVLIDHRSASATEPLAALLQHHQRARLIGERSAGAMLSSEEFELGDGWRLNLPVAEFYAADGKRIEGNGVVPDEQVKSSEALFHALELARGGAGEPIADRR